MRSCCILAVTLALGCGPGSAAPAPAPTAAPGPAPAAVPRAALPTPAAIVIGEDSACTISDARDVVCWGAAVGAASPLRHPAGRGAIALAGHDPYFALLENGDVIQWAYAGALRGQPGVLFSVPGATELVKSSEHVCARAPGTSGTCDAIATLARSRSFPPEASRVLSLGTFACSLHEGVLRCGGARSFVIEDEPVIDAAADADRVCFASEQRVRCAPSATIDLAPRLTTIAGLPGAERIAVGSEHVCALTEGRVRCAGWNGLGALGPGAPPNVSGAFDVPFPSAVSAIAARGSTTCARTEGGVYCFGEASGSVAGSAPRGLVRVDVGELTSIASYEHSCGITRAGRVWCWGSGRGGQLGGAALGAHATPIEVPDVEGARELVLGYGRSCALDADGAVCWGGGDHRGNHRRPPHRVISGAITSMSINGSFAAVLGRRGALEFWSLASGTRVTDAGDVPALPSIPAAVEVDLMRFALCARVAGGRVACRGGSSNGEHGSGSREPLVEPRFVLAPLAPTPENVALAAAGCSGSACRGELRSVTALRTFGFTSLAVLGSGELACWGSNPSGVCAPEAADRVLVPLLRDDVHDAADACGGIGYGCALRRDGRVHCWGEETAPVISTGAFRAIEGATAISCGQHHACALYADGHADCWGRSDGGRLGSALAIVAEPQLVTGTR